MTGRQTRAERAAYPLARESIRKIAESYGGCLRPVSCAAPTLTLLAGVLLRRDTAVMAGQDTTDYDELIDELDIKITRAGVRGTVTTNHGRDGRQRARRSRSTQRRQDAARCPPVRSLPAPPAGCSPRRMASATGRRCS